jgi:hypothetical protein
MRLLSPEIAAWVVVLVLGDLAVAAPLAGQEGVELGIQAVVTGSEPLLAVGGLYGALRPSTRTRLSAAAGAGISSDDAAFRAEVLGHFLLSPNKRQGAGFYLAGGVAAVAGPVDKGYLVLTAGLEGRPGAKSGWAAELGIGGGVRLALGYRWRWLRVR